MFRMETVDKILVGAMFTFSLTSWVFYVGFLVLRQDPFYFVLDDIIGSEAGSTLPLILRMVLMFAEFEFVRSGTLFLSIALVGVSRWQKIVNVLLHNQRVRNAKRVVYYVKFQILHIEMSPLLNDATTIAISSLFWGLVFLICFILNGPASSQLVIYVLMASFGIVGLFLAMFGLNLLASLLENVVEIVNKCKKVAEYEVLQGSVGTQGRQAAKATKLQTKSLQALQIKYKPFHVIDKEFVVGVYENMFFRVLDAMLIF
ncbi:unnamed protein product [Orchesella dallaii]|uniref:Uncharacterized protein n=1 Tax=Orchesella dallaii TaxID=48710 RepID=A0ABP1RJV4_9HEXA